MESTADALARDAGFFSLAAVHWLHVCAPFIFIFMSGLSVFPPDKKVILFQVRILLNYFLNTQI